MREADGEEEGAQGSPVGLQSAPEAGGHEMGLLEMVSSWLCDRRGPCWHGAGSHWQRWLLAQG